MNKIDLPQLLDETFDFIDEKLGRAPLRPRYTRAQIEAVLDQLSDSLGVAIALHPKPYNSAHEAFAVLLEEVEEFKAEVFKKSSERDSDALRDELLQVATVALRAVIDLDLLPQTAQANGSQANGSQAQEVSP